jgi:heavy metal sensor kinase/RND family efflux transporter MFP subunit
VNRPRSIRLKLITLYVGLLTVVFLCFGAYIYGGFHQFLVRSLEQALDRRALQITSTILEELPSRGESYVGSEIQARYAPELNERVIRVTEAGGRVIYASKNAGLLSSVVNSSEVAKGKPVYRAEGVGNGQDLRVVTVSRELSNGITYLVEVGGPENEMVTALHHLLATLAIGFPVLIGLSILGGYSLLGRALNPVNDIVSAAERITFKNLSRRLPVPRTGDEFERISEALNRMIQRLEEAFQIANRFSADASHELRTPLTIIRGELEAFAENPALTPELAERAADILEEVDQLARIVEGLLLVSRLEAGEAQMKLEAVDLGDMAESIAGQMELLSEEKRLTVRREIEREVVVEGDRVRLKQVVVNLLDNAIKYTPEGGTIWLKVRSSENRAVLEIADTGIGIDPAALPHIFDRFYRSAEAKAGRVDGTGLGLAIVHSIMEAHGGGVSAGSRENQGSVFRVELPLWRKGKVSRTSLTVKTMVLASALLGTASCSRSPAPAADDSSGGGNAAPVVAVAKVSRQDLSKSVDLTAEFLPWQQVEIHAKVAGYVKEINVDVGDHAKRGDVLATLEIPELQDELKQADAAILTAEENVKSMQAAYDESGLEASRMNAAAKETQGLIAQQDLDNANDKNRGDEANLAAAQQRVVEAHANADHLRDLVAYSQIVAPFDGVVTRRYADTGALVQAGTVQAGTTGNSNSMPLVSFEQIDKLRLEFPVPESDVAFVHVGGLVDITIVSSGKKIEGKVSRFAQKVDTSTRTMLTEVDVDNADEAYTPGMYATVRLALAREKDALAVPIQSLTPGDPPSVMVVKDRKIEKREVTVGIETPDEAEILGGLDEGDFVVVGNRTSLQPGQAATPQLVDNPNP